MLHIKYLLTLDNPLSPNKKCDPLTALAIGSSIVGGIGNLIGQSDANASNMAIARANREWQSEENQKARDYQTQMWERQNEYNTPANQRQLLMDAGYNPFVLEQNGSTSAAGGGSVPGMQSLPNQPHMEPINPLGGVSSLMNAVSLSNQKEQVDSTVESNKANIVKTLSEAAIDAYDKLGQKGFTDLMSKISPILKSLTFEGSRSDIMFNEYLKNNLSQRYNQDMDSLNKEIEYNLGKKYGEQRIQSNLEKLSYEISEIVGRLNTMGVQNDALISQTAADLIVKGAHAFMLRSQGKQYVADTQTANELREWLVKSVKHQANIRSIDEQFKNASWESSSELIGYITSKRGRESISESVRIPLERKADALWTAVDKMFSDYIKTSSSGSAGSYGSVTSYNGYESSSTSYGW